MKSLLVAICSYAVLPLAALAQQPSVQVQPPELGGSRPLEKQTEASVVRDYLQSWKNLDDALSKNQAELLDVDFVGVAHDKFAETIAEQTRLGLRTHYRELSHNLQIVFYSPEGLSIQLLDTVEYVQQVIEGDKIVASHPIKARYLAVLTPSAVRWKIRILQAETK